MNAELRKMRSDLIEIAEKEATKLYRLAWRMQAHGCDPENIKTVREEANALHMTGYPERLLSYFTTYKYAFKF